MADAVVVGSGPNGLAAAITLAKAGLSVEVFEGAKTPGGGCRTEELTLPGFHHDVCSAVHPLLMMSPFFKQMNVEQLGVKLLTPKYAFCHPLDGGRVGAVSMSVDETASGLGADARTYRRTFRPLARNAQKIVPTLLEPLRSVPRHPLAMGKFGIEGLFPARTLAKRFTTEEARGIFAGAAAHSMLELNAPLTGSFGLLFTTMAHSSGWPIVEGGSAHITDAMMSVIESMGGEVHTGHWIKSLDELPKSKLVMLDVTPRQFLQMAKGDLPPRYSRALEHFKYASGVCKVDWVLSGPVPWTAEQCRQAGTVHVGGTFDEVAKSESDVAAGRHPVRPYCLVAQPSVLDPTRAPDGMSTLWAYCHVPSGSNIDMTDRIEAQIERFAPGFRDRIVAKATRTAVTTERHNPNCVGGDVSGGLANLRQTLFRPTVAWNNYKTPIDGVYLCSASTPPGGGVHGMCGFNSARSALRHLGKTV
ncbi:MAG: NAD(P)/FAD-dependent oxidoreductase [Acidimicrobiales bacterium]